MNEVQVTVVGTVCSEVRYGTTGENGVPVARFQVRSLPRRYDRRAGTWSDGEPSYYSVTCWRRLAEHAASSLGVGDPVLATGRLRITRWRRNEETMVSAELDAQSVGHDLRWGTSVYRKGMSTVARIPGPRRRSPEESTPAEPPGTPGAESGVGLQLGAAAADPTTAAATIAIATATATAIEAAAAPPQTSPGPLTPLTAAPPRASPASVPAESAMAA